MQPRVTAILVAHEGAQFLERTLAALAAQTRRPDQVVAVDLGSTRLAGTEPGAVPAVARADDVREVVVDGERVVQDGRHRAVDAARELREAIADLRTP